MDIAFEEIDPKEPGTKAWGSFVGLLNFVIMQREGRPFVVMVTVDGHPEIKYLIDEEDEIDQFDDAVAVCISWLNIKFG